MERRRKKERVGAGAPPRVPQEGLDGLSSHKELHWVGQEHGKGQERPGDVGDGVVPLQVVEDVAPGAAAEAKVPGESEGEREGRGDGDGDQRDARPLARYGQRVADQERRVLADEGEAEGAEGLGIAAVGDRVDGRLLRQRPDALGLRGGRRPDGDQRDDDAHGDNAEAAGAAEEPDVPKGTQGEAHLGDCAFVIFLRS